MSKPIEIIIQPNLPSTKSTETNTIAPIGVAGAMMHTRRGYRVATIDPNFWVKKINFNQVRIN